MVLESAVAAASITAMPRLLLTTLLAACLTACTSPRPPLQVKPYILRDQQRDAGSDPWTRMEQQSRLRGAISMEERRQRLGQYYTVLWNDSDTQGGPVTLTFHYQQGASASRVKRMTHTFAPHETSGRASFAITGDDYITHGRVLAWKATLQRGDREIASRQSYLWQ